MISIRVPATTANIGPGYDVLGAALTLYASFEAELSEKLEISGCPEEFQNEDNLVIRAYKKTLSDCGKDYVPIRLAIDTNVPIARGLGSSSTCIAAGVLAADSLHGLGLSRDRIVSICTEIEGHPDNVAPAVYGGVVAGFSDGKDIHTIRYTPDEGWRFVTVIPDYEVHTEEARRVVKKEIELSDGIYSTGHVLGLIRALETGDEEQYEIVGSQEANPMAGRISDDSPFGRAMVGRKEGDQVEVEAPVGMLRFEILTVEKKA